jgi:hypothetical protein
VDRLWIDCGLIVDLPFSYKHTRKEVIAKQYEFDNPGTVAPIKDEPHATKTGGPVVTGQENGHSCLKRADPNDPRSIETFKRLRDAPSTGRRHQELRKLIVLKAGGFRVLSYIP